MKIKIGSRRSKLALKQSKIIIDLINTIDKSINCEIVEITTIGDRRLDLSLSEFGGKGAFVSEIEDRLISGDIDIAVHSAKDLPIDLPKGLHIGAVSKRANPCDVLILNKGVKLDKAAVIGTGSQRRIVQIKDILDVQTKDIRGNIDTRLSKLQNGDYDAIILAAAGIERMGYDNNANFDYHYLNYDKFTPAPCQGIIGIECRKDSYVNSILNKINHNETFIQFEAERKLLQEMNSGCKIPFGAYSYIKNNCINITAYYYANKQIRVSNSGPINKHMELAIQTANEIKEQM